MEDCIIFYLLIPLHLHNHSIITIDGIFDLGALLSLIFKILPDIIYYRNILPQIMLVLSHIKDGYYFISTSKFALYILIIQFEDYIELSYFLTQYNKELPKLYREPLVSRLHPPCPLQYPLKWYSNWYRILRLFIQRKNTHSCGCRYR